MHRGLKRGWKKTEKRSVENLKSNFQTNKERDFLEDLMRTVSLPQRLQNPIDTDLLCEIFIKRFLIKKKASLYIKRIAFYKNGSAVFLLSLYSTYREKSVFTPMKDACENYE